jgi:hypothetical protein
MVARMSNDHIELNSETARIRGILVNAGNQTFAQAEQRLAASQLSIAIGSEAARTTAGQAALLTAVLTGVRCFGTVTVEGSIDYPLLLPLPLTPPSLAAAAHHFGARRAPQESPSRRVLLGAEPLPGTWSVQAYWDGWTVGVGPPTHRILIGQGDVALAGVAAGALAVGQAFLAEQNDPRAGKAAQAVSLWSPELEYPCVNQSGPSWCDLYLPTDLWLVGLGNLGQAYLWSLLLLPYEQPEAVRLFLQDDQTIDRENWGTSVLVQRGRYGIPKTRIAEEWATRRGYTVRRIDRRLDARLHRSDFEPGILLAGLDRMPARRVLGPCGFAYIIDAGLGATAADYHRFRVNTFDATSDPAVHFQGVEDQTERVAAELLRLPAYQELARNRDDGGCGAAQLAGASVAVPFVSAFAGALVVTQAVRIASGHAHHAGITGDLGDPHSTRAVLGTRPERIIVPNASATPLTRPHLQ